jgi:hypothetical protein
MAIATSAQTSEEPLPILRSPPSHGLHIRTLALTRRWRQLPPGLAQRAVFPGHPADGPGRRPTDALLPRGACACPLRALCRPRCRLARARRRGVIQALTREKEKGALVLPLLFTSALRPAGSLRRTTALAADTRATGINTARLALGACSAADRGPTAVPTVASSIFCPHRRTHTARLPTCFHTVRRATRTTRLRHTASGAALEGATTWSSTTLPFAPCRSPPPSSPATTSPPVGAHAISVTPAGNARAQQSSSS